MPFWESDAHRWPDPDRFVCRNGTFWVVGRHCRDHLCDGDAQILSLLLFLVEVDDVSSLPFSACRRLSPAESPLLERRVSLCGCHLTCRVRSGRNTLSVGEWNKLWISNKTKTKKKRVARQMPVKDNLIRSEAKLCTCWIILNVCGRVAIHWR